MKINCIILDDEPENLKFLQQIVEDIDDVHIVRSFTDAQSFTEQIKKLDFDMCILDNKLPDGSGLELAKKLRKKKIVFVSAHNISAHEAYDIGAIDVLTKPVNPARLREAIKKCRDKIIYEKGYVFFKTIGGETKFKWEEIIYITTAEDSQCKLIFTNDGEIRTAKMDFDDILSKLPNSLFCKISKSHLLNTQYFKAFRDRDTIVLNHKINNKNIVLETGGKYLGNVRKLVGIVDVTDS